MSKYIKLEDALNCVNGYFLTGIHKAIESLPTIEVSEDCISREWVKGICENMLDEEMLGHMLGYIEDAPSVVPSTEQSSKVGEWLLDGKCSNCLQAPLTTHKTYCPNCGAKMKG